MAEKARKIEDYSRVLVVEGYGDLLFYAEVLEAVGKHSQVFIKELGGKADLARKLEILITPAILATKEALAFVFDADERPDTARGELETLLSRLTSQRVVDGSWTEGRPRVGLLLVPGGAVPGEIETLVWQSWGSDPANGAQFRSRGRRHTAALSRLAGEEKLVQSISPFCFEAAGRLKFSTAT
jgi:hypothetical protein